MLFLPLKTSSLSGSIVRTCGCFGAAIIKYYIKCLLLSFSKYKSEYCQLDICLKRAKPKYRKIVHSADPPFCYDKCKPVSAGLD